MKKLWHFIKSYRLFFIMLVTAAVALGLDLGGLDTAAHWLLGIAAVIALFPLLKGMVDDLRDGTYGVDVLAVIAISTAVLMHQYWAGMVIVLMLTGGEALEDYAERRAHRELDALLSRAPQRARILRGTREIEVAISDVQVGDKVVIRPGEVVPVDAQIIEGVSDFDESSLTGESLPQSKRDGDIILSGSITVDGAITARALHAAADSQYQQIIKLVKATQAHQAPFVRMADRYAIPFTFLSLTIALFAWGISRESIRFLEVLVVATPCPLILAAPIAIISGMSRASKQGIIIKNGSALERLAEARTFAFDKTGTLTAGDLTIDSVKAFGAYKNGDVLSYAAGLEQGSSHILAQAILKRAEKGGHKPVKAKHVKELSGRGLQANVGGKQVLVGRLSLFQAEDVAMPKTFDAKQFDQTAAYVAIDGTLVGVITFKDEVRATAKDTLTSLQRLGVGRFLMVTGDNKATAKAVAKKLGIKDFVAEALPGDKIHAIEAVGERDRPVAFVGDGVNDAPVLTASEVGIAMGARGSTAASESADVVIMLDDISHVATARDIARRTFFVARQSILVGIGLSIILMLVFATGAFKPIYGAAIQELVDVVVIFNALRAHTAKRQ